MTLAELRPDGGGRGARNAPARGEPVQQVQAVAAVVARAVRSGLEAVTRIDHLEPDRLADERDMELER